MLNDTYVNSKIRNLEVENENTKENTGHHPYCYIDRRAVPYTTDLLMLLGSYLEVGENLLADLDGDGQVNYSDLLLLLSNYLELDVTMRIK